MSENLYRVITQTPEEIKKFPIVQPGANKPEFQVDSYTFQSFQGLNKANRLRAVLTHSFCSENTVTQNLTIMYSMVKAVPSVVPLDDIWGEAASASLESLLWSIFMFRQHKLFMEAFRMQFMLCYFYPFAMYKGQAYPDHHVHNESKDSDSEEEEKLNQLINDAEDFVDLNAFLTVEGSEDVCEHPATPSTSFVLSSSDSQEVFDAIREQSPDVVLIECDDDESPPIPSVGDQPGANTAQQNAIPPEPCISPPNGFCKAANINLELTPTNRLAAVLKRCNVTSLLMHCLPGDAKAVNDVLCALPFPPIKTIGENEDAWSVYSAIERLLILFDEKHAMYGSLNLRKSALESSKIEILEELKSHWPRAAIFLDTIGDNIMTPNAPVESHMLNFVTNRMIDKHITDLSNEKNSDLVFAFAAYLHHDLTSNYLSIGDGNLCGVSCLPSGDTNPNCSHCRWATTILDRYDDGLSVEVDDFVYHPNITIMTGDVDDVVVVPAVAHLSFMGLAAFLVPGGFLASFLAMPVWYFTSEFFVSIYNAGFRQSGKDFWTFLKLNYFNGEEWKVTFANWLRIFTIFITLYAIYTAVRDVVRRVVNRSKMKRFVKQNKADNIETALHYLCLITASISMIGGGFFTLFRMRHAMKPILNMLGVMQIVNRFSNSSKNSVYTFDEKKNKQDDKFKTKCYLDYVPDDMLRRPDVTIQVTESSKYDRAQIVVSDATGVIFQHVVPKITNDTSTIDGFLSWVWSFLVRYKQEFFFALGFFSLISFFAVIAWWNYTPTKPETKRGKNKVRARNTQKHTTQYGYEQAQKGENIVAYEQAQALEDYVAYRDQIQQNIRDAISKEYDLEGSNSERVVSSLLSQYRHTGELSSGWGGESRDILLKLIAQNDNALANASMRLIGSMATREFANKAGRLIRAEIDGSNSRAGLIKMAANLKKSAAAIPRIKEAIAKDTSALDRIEKMDAMYNVNDVSIARDAINKNRRTLQDLIDQNRLENKIDDKKVPQPPQNAATKQILPKPAETTVRADIPVTHKYYKSLMQYAKENALKIVNPVFTINIKNDKFFVLEAYTNDLKFRLARPGGKTTWTHVVGNGTLLAGAKALPLGKLPTTGDSTTPASKAVPTTANVTTEAKPKLLNLQSIVHKNESKALPVPDLSALQSVYQFGVGDFDKDSFLSKPDAGVIGTMKKVVIGSNTFVDTAAHVVSELIARNTNVWFFPISEMANITSGKTKPFPVDVKWLHTFRVPDQDVDYALTPKIPQNMGARPLKVSAPVLPLSGVHCVIAHFDGLTSNLSVSSNTHNLKDGTHNCFTTKGSSGGAVLIPTDNDTWVCVGTHRGVRGDGLKTFIPYVSTDVAPDLSKSSGVNGESKGVTEHLTTENAILFIKSFAVGFVLTQVAVIILDSNYRRFVTLKAVQGAVTVLFKLADWFGLTPKHDHSKMHRGTPVEIVEIETKLSSNPFAVLESMSSCSSSEIEGK